MYRHEERESLSQEEAWGLAQDRLFNRHEHRTAWYEAMHQCEKLIIDIPDSVISTDIYRIFMYMMPDFPIRIAYQLVRAGAVVSDSYSVLYSASIFSDVEILQLPLDTDEDVTLRNYLIRRYFNSTEIRYFPGAGARNLPCLTLELAAYRSLTMDQVYENFKEYWPSLGGKVKGGNKRYVQGFQDSAWSAASWPEVEGIATRYLDNVGLFLPDYCEIDYNLSHSLGKAVVGCILTRPPDSEAEAALFNLRSFQSLMEFLFAGTASSAGYQSGSQRQTYNTMQGKAISGQRGAGAAQGGVDTYKFIVQDIEKWLGRVRICFPRIRAFGRQETPVTYSEYERALNAVVGNFQTTTNGGKTYYHALWNTKIVIKMDRIQFDTFVAPFQAIINAAQNAKVTL